MNSPSELFYCRFCAEKKPFDDLLDLEENPEDIETCLERVILLKMDYVNITSCKLPKLICEPCYNALYDASLFISKVRGAQIILNAVLDTKSEIKSTEDKPDIGDAQSCTDDNDMGNPEIEEEVFETKFKTEFEKDPLDTAESQFGIEDNATENLILSVVSSELREEGIAKEEVATCSNIFRNCNNMLEKPQYLNRNINTYNKDDLKGKVLLKNSTGIGIHNNPCPLLKLHQECILKDTECKVQDSTLYDKNYSPISSRSKTTDECKGNTAESVNYVDDISKRMHLTDYGIREKPAHDSLNSVESFEDKKPNVSTNTVTHDENIFEISFLRERHMKSNSDISKEKLTKPDQNYGQGITKNFLDKDTDNVVQDNISELLKDRSWSQYTWMCQHCQTVYRTMSVVREHSKQYHKKCCAYTCMDCQDLFISFIAFVEHVRQHRTSLRWFIFFFLYLLI